MVLTLAFGSVTVLNGFCLWCEAGSRSPPPTSGLGVFSPWVGRVFLSPSQSIAAPWLLWPSG